MRGFHDNNLMKTYDHVFTILQPTCPWRHEPRKGRREINELCSGHGGENKPGVYRITIPRYQVSGIPQCLPRRTLSEHLEGRQYPRWGQWSFDCSLKFNRVGRVATALSEYRPSETRPDCRGSLLAPTTTLPFRHGSQTNIHTTITYSKGCCDRQYSLHWKPCSFLLDNKSSFFFLFSFFFFFPFLLSFNDKNNKMFVYNYVNQ